MALDLLMTADIIRLIECFLVKRRPPEHIRHKLDIDYKIEKQSVVIFELRPHWDNMDEKIESPIAKTTWVEKQQIWKIFWRRADAKWHAYSLNPKVESFSEFLQIVDEDKNGCFWG